MYNRDSNTFNEEYFVKDHLDNVRSIVDVYNYPVLNYLATYEVASANLENFFFDAIDGVWDERAGATWNGDPKSARLNGDDAERRTGTSLILKVMAGDHVEMNVNNFYDGYDPGEDSPLGMEDDALIGQRTSALEGLAGKPNIGGMQNIQKQVYYAKEKIKAWKELADEPDDAEEKALIMLMYVCLAINCIILKL